VAEAPIEAEKALEEKGVNEVVTEESERKTSECLERSEIASGNDRSVVKMSLKYNDNSIKELISKTVPPECHINSFLQQHQDLITGYIQSYNRAKAATRNAHTNKEHQNNKDALTEKIKAHMKIPGWYILTDVDLMNLITTVRPNAYNHEGVKMEEASTGKKDLTYLKTPNGVYLTKHAVVLYFEII